ncbi:hypothetical protein Mal4_04400 [Maioricimonas rarisocia]|uniref:Outer membrane efflux protein n=1 Tax=Maioricimonas rarisocia TaxID=2528026 RepID=A0A517Z102_9PLAN|nr:hypothetical protein [Maioricimonas rarisocia]QDU36157.1 hypothetical protein Mal4_04400 [Maioricimonas rarisocia]
MQSTSTLTIVMLACCLVALTHSPPVRSQQPESPRSERLQALLTERRDTLRELLEVVTLRHQQGLASIDELVRTRSVVIDAELELAKTRADRLSLLQQQVDNLRELEELTRKRYESSQIPLGPTLTAKAARLAAAIDLERVRLTPE